MSFATSMEVQHKFTASGVTIVLYAVRERGCKTRYNRLGLPDGKECVDRTRLGFDGPFVNAFHTAADILASRMLHPNILNVALAECSKDLNVSQFIGRSGGGPLDWNSFEQQTREQFDSLRAGGFPEIHIEPWIDDAGHGGEADVCRCVEAKGGRLNGAFKQKRNVALRPSTPADLASSIAHEMLHNLGHGHIKDSYRDRNFTTVFQNVMFNNGKYDENTINLLGGGPDAICGANLADQWEHWPTLDAGLLHPNGFAYFFRGRLYRKYDFMLDRVVKEGVIGKHGWIGVWSDLDAAINHPSGAAYFFKGNRYQKFSFEQDKVVHTDREIGKIGWKGVWSDIDAATLHPNGHAYFFKGSQYQKYSFHREDGSEGIVGKPSRRIGTDGWYGVWEDGVEAAVKHPNQCTYFFRGDEYRKYDFDDEDGEGVVKKGRTRRNGWFGM